VGIAERFGSFISLEKFTISSYEFKKLDDLKETDRLGLQAKSARDDEDEEFDSSLVSVIAVVLHKIAIPPI